MKILKQLIKLHRFLFWIAMLFTFLSIILNLCWNKFLARVLDILGGVTAIDFANRPHVIIAALPTGIFIILFHIISEYLSSYLSSYTCEIFAHEMRMGYIRYYLQGDIRMLSRMNVGEEQSAMQNELKDISDYLNENLFSLVTQFGTFVVTVVFLLCQNVKLAFISILPVIPLSIRDNITCGHEISEEIVWTACQNASLTEWIGSLPDGLNMNVGERGSQVSGGQAQRIQIARALCKDAPIILLDEPVSALDQGTGHSVLKTLNKLTEGRTVIHVTHQQETLGHGYTIYRMKGGKLIRV